MFNQYRANKITARIPKMIWANDLIIGQTTSCLSFEGFFKVEYRLHCSFNSKTCDGINNKMVSNNPFRILFRGFGKIVSIVSARSNMFQLITVAVRKIKAIKMYPPKLK